MQQTIQKWQRDNWRLEEPVRLLWQGERSFHTLGKSIEDDVGSRFCVYRMLELCKDFGLTESQSAVLPDESASAEGLGEGGTEGVSEGSNAGVEIPDNLSELGAPELKRLLALCCVSKTEVRCSSAQSGCYAVASCNRPAAARQLPSFHPSEPAQPVWTPSSNPDFDEFWSPGTCKARMVPLRVVSCVHLYSFAYGRICGCTS